MVVLDGDIHNGIHADQSRVHVQIYNLSEWVLSSVLVGMNDYNHILLENTW